MPLIHRCLGPRDYESTWEAMRRFTDGRTPATPDELWTLQHPPLFTLGQAGRPEHLLNPGPIPVLRSDRGGQVTYHGPGQLIAYLLYDLKRAGIGIRSLVRALEQAVVDLLAEHGIPAAPRAEAPGVYVEGRKIASLGLRVRHGYSYHGLALNWAMDLGPFARINPCGYPGLEVTQIADFGPPGEFVVLERRLARHLAHCLGRTLEEADLGPDGPFQDPEAVADGPRC